MTTLQSIATPLPAVGLSATEPPEARGLARDEVRLLVADSTAMRHVLFRDLPAFLDPGDVVVVNTSATLPAAFDGRRCDGTAVRVHVAALPDAGWAAELRLPSGGRFEGASAGDEIALPEGIVARLVSAYPDPSAAMGSRLWRLTLPVPDVHAYMRRAGRPVAYDYVRGHWPLAMYQTVFARDPGSAEMPSAGRPFSTSLVTDLVAKGVAVAPITLHTGLSSLDAHELPLAEQYAVPETTARIVNAARVRGGRIIAVGTTVARALETVAEPLGTLHAASGWTDLVLGPGRPCRVIDGLITGWHDAGASHLLLLEAVVGAERVADAYEVAVAERYRWHEFGDACLFLP